MIQGVQIEQFTIDFTIWKRAYNTLCTIYLSLFTQKATPWTSDPGDSIIFAIAGSTWCPPLRLNDSLQSFKIAGVWSEIMNFLYLLFHKISIYFLES